MKKFLALFLVVVCSLSLVFATGCNNIPTPKKNKLTTEDVAHTIIFQSATALQSAESLDLIQDAVPSEVTPEATEPEAPAPEATEPEAPAPQEGVLGNEIGGIMQNADLLTSGAELINEVSDREGYEMKVILRYEAVECILYLNIVEDTQEVETEEEDGVVEEEIEITKKYDGVIVFNGNEYEFKAETSVEIEGDEREEEITLKIFITKDTYIFINQEFEVEGDEKEESFKYRFYENKELVEEYKISKEVEGDKGSLKIVKNGEVYKYKYYIENEQEYIQIMKDTITEVYQKVLNKDGTVTYDVVE